MIYPLPGNIEDQPVAKAAVYDFVPEYSHEIDTQTYFPNEAIEKMLWVERRTRRSPSGLIQQDPDLGFGGFLPAFNGIEGTNATITRQWSSGVVSEPVEILVANGSSTAQQVNLFDAFNNLLSSNFGNPSGITIASNTLNTTYAEMLRQSDQRPFRPGRIRIQILNDIPDEAAFWRWLNFRYTQSDANGDSSTTQPRFRVEPWMTNTRILDYAPPSNWIVNSYSSYRFTLPANTSIRLTIFKSVEQVEPQVMPGDRWSGIDEFANVEGFNPVDSFGSDQLNAAELNRFTLSPSALAALRGDNIQTPTEQESDHEALQRWFNPSRLQRLREGMVAKRARRAERKQSRIDARNAYRAAKRASFNASGYRHSIASPAYIDVSVEIAFLENCEAEFTLPEQAAILELKDTDPVKYKHLVENYNFDAFGSNLGDYL